MPFQLAQFAPLKYKFLHFLLNGAAVFTRTGHDQWLECSSVEGDMGIGHRLAKIVSAAEARVVLSGLPRAERTVKNDQL